MARKSESKVIGESRFTVHQFGAIQGRSMLIKLTKIVGSLVAFEADPAKALSSIAEDDLTALCDEFAAHTDVAEVKNPSKAPRLSDVFDDEFAGKYEEMIQWLMFALEVNFTGFFQKGKAALKGLGQGGSVPPAVPPPPSES